MNRKKTPDAVQKEVALEVDQLLRTIFTGMHNSGHFDLEAIEMLVRSAMHQAGAAAVTELLRLPEPDQRSIPCPCGQQARYRELRPKSILTAVGEVQVSPPYYLCAHCHQGQFPADQELDVVDTDRREQMNLLGANAILALRCCHLNGRFEDYWAGRRAA